MGSTTWRGTMCLNARAHMCTVLLENKEVQMDGVANNETQDMLVQMCIEANDALTQVYGDKPPKPLKKTTHTGPSTQTNTTISTAHAVVQMAPTMPYTSAHMPATSETTPHTSSPTPTLYTMGAVPKAMKCEPSTHYEHPCTSVTSPDIPSTSHCKGNSQIPTFQLCDSCDTL